MRYNNVTGLFVAGMKFQKEMFEGGYIQGSYYYFYERDHLGNNCAVVQGRNALAGQAV